MLEFHHIGLLTDQPEAARQRLKALGYAAGPIVDDPLQEARLQMCVGSPGVAAIELVTPLPSNRGLGNLLKRRGDFMYHICFTAPTFDVALQSLSLGSDDRILTVSPPKPAILFGNARVAFYLASGLGLVEVLERT